MENEKRWTDADLENAFNCYPIHLEFWEWLEEYKKDHQKYTDRQIAIKLDECRLMLVRLGMPEEMISKTTQLAFVALCSIKPDTKWSEATRTSMRMSKDIMQFAIDNYGLKEHSNNRDQFRREAINILLNYELIDMNPDNKTLGPNSPLTHYAVKQRVINKLINR